MLHITNKAKALACEHLIRPPSSLVFTLDERSPVCYEAAQFYCEAYIQEFMQVYFALVGNTNPFKAVTTCSIEHPAFAVAWRDMIQPKLTSLEKLRITHSSLSFRCIQPAAECFNSLEIISKYEDGLHSAVKSLSQINSQVRNKITAIHLQEAISTANFLTCTAVKSFSILFPNLTHLHINQLDWKTSLCSELCIGVFPKLAALSVASHTHLSDVNLFASQVPSLKLYSNTEIYISNQLDIDVLAMERSSFSLLSIRPNTRLFIFLHSSFTLTRANKLPANIACLKIKKAEICFDNILFLARISKMIEHVVPKPVTSLTLSYFPTNPVQKLITPFAYNDIMVKMNELLGVNVKHRIDQYNLRVKLVT
jgi:hypothetical protein